MRFERPEIIRPPSEADSYFLPLTSGCSNNSCIFCNFYGHSLKIREPAEIFREIDALALYLQHGLQVPGMPDIIYSVARCWDGRRIFLQDGDALVYPFPQLQAILKYICDKLPSVERIACYATAQDILRRNLQELQILKYLKLGILYMGVESGDDAILTNIHKNITSQELVRAGQLIKSAGIASSVTVILGLGGQDNTQAHTLATARILTQLDPDYVGALTLTLIPGTPMFDLCRQGKFSPIPPLQSLIELKAIIENSSFSNCFFSSMHASNYFSLRGRLPDEKPRLLAELSYIISRRDPSLLRPEFMRGL